MRRKKVRNGITTSSDYFKGEHMNLEVLKEMKSLHDNEYLYLAMPPYPKAVFHIASVSHVTDASRIGSIMGSSGFRGGESDLVFWGLHVEESDIEAAESRYLNKEFSDSSSDEATSSGKRKRQEPFLQKFTTSPAFAAESRYGNYKFTFPIKRLLELYRDQCCAGEQPVMRIYETEIFKKKIAYTVVVHSPASEMFDSYPILSCDDSSAVCAYQSDKGTVLWRAQAICDNHDYGMIVDEDNQVIYTEPHNRGLRYYVWDGVALAFHLPEGKLLEIEYTELYTSLTACEGVEIPNLAMYPNTFDAAKRKLEEFHP